MLTIIWVKRRWKFCWVRKSLYIYYYCSASFIQSFIHSFSIQFFFVHLLNLPLTWNEVGSTNHFLPITWNAFCLLRWCIMVFRFNVFQAKSFPLCCRYFISHPAFPSHTHTLRTKDSLAWKKLQSEKKEKNEKEKRIIVDDDYEERKLNRVHLSPSLSVTFPLSGLYCYTVCC